MSNMCWFIVPFLAAFVQCQDIYIVANGTAATSTCATKTSGPKLNVSYSEWEYKHTTTVRYVTPLAYETQKSTYAAPYSKVSTLLPANISTTTWGSWLPGQTDVSANDTENPYGNAAWQQLWVNANLTNYTTIGLYSTTLAPHAVPTNELIAPPPNYFGPEDCYKLPEDFIYGASAAAGQIEGAIGVEGRTPSILERFITNGTGDNSNYVANENYFLYKQDIARMAAAGMKWYSFSISWSRILPFAKANTVTLEMYIDHVDSLHTPF